MSASEAISLPLPSGAPLTDDAWQYVGFWPRLLGTVADYLLVTAFVTPILVLIYGPGYLFDETLIQGSWHIIIGSLLPTVAVLCFLFKYQATPGKMFIQSHIVHEDTGERPHRHQFVIRYLAFALSLLPLGLGCIWVALDHRKQSWHDKLAKTVVVRKP